MSTRQMLRSSGVGGGGAVDDNSDGGNIESDDMWI